MGIFNSLSKKDLRGIVKIETKRLEKRLEERSIYLHITDSALDYLADVGFDPVYGARPLKRTISRELETSVARGILKGDFDDKDTILVDLDKDHDGKLSITKASDADFVVTNVGTTTTTSEEEEQEVSTFD